MIEDRLVRQRIAANITRYRGDLSYSEIARRIGDYPINVSRVANAKNMPGAGLLMRIAEALGVTVNDLLAEPQKPARRRPSA